MKHANIFDPIQPQLDPHVFRRGKPRNSVVQFIEQKFNEVMETYFIDEPHRYFELVLTGSLTTYQFSEVSDADISVYPHYDDIIEHLGEGNEHDLRWELVSIVTAHLDGAFLPGTQHPLQFFVLPEGDNVQDRFKKGLRSGWSFRLRGWLNAPEKDRVHTIADEFPQLYQRASFIADKMRTLLDGGALDEVRELFQQIHKKRSMDQNSGLGDFSEGNIVYKYLLHEGLFDRLRDETGVKIAAWKEPGVRTSADKQKVIYDFERDRLMIAHDAEVPRGSKLIGEYDGKNVNLKGVDKQWINANYFKRLWIHTFPGQEIDNVYFEGNEVATRPAGEMTYTEQLPEIVAAGVPEWFIEALALSGILGTVVGFNASTFWHAYQQWRANSPEDDSVKAFLKSWVDPKEWKEWKDNWNEEQNQREAKDPWRKGKDWKDFIKNEGIIVEFQMGDKESEKFDGRVKEIYKDKIILDVGGDKRTLDNELLRQIKFKVRDEKRHLSGRHDFEYITKPENYGPLKMNPPTGDVEFNLPPDVEQKFLDIMECPHCHSNLLRDENGVYCPTCTWVPKSAHCLKCSYNLTNEDHDWIKLAHGWFACPSCQGTYHYSWKDPYGREEFRWGWFEGDLEIQHEEYMQRTHTDMMEDWGYTWHEDVKDSGALLGYGWIDQEGTMILDMQSYDYGRMGYGVPDNILEQIKNYMQDEGYEVNEVVVK